MPFAVEIWWTPTHYGDASADEYAEIKRSLDGAGLFQVTLKSTEWAQYSDVLGRQYDAFQLGWFPDYPDVENYVVPFYRSDTFLANGYRNPRMDDPDQAGAQGRSGRRDDCGLPPDPAARRAGRADHPGSGRAT